MGSIVCFLFSARISGFSLKLKTTDFSEDSCRARGHPLARLQTLDHYSAWTNELYVAEDCASPTLFVWLAQSFSASVLVEQWVLLEVFRGVLSQLSSSQEMERGGAYALAGEHPCVCLRSEVTRTWNAICQQWQGSYSVPRWFLCLTFL